MGKPHAKVAAGHARLLTERLGETARASNRGRRSACGLLFCIGGPKEAAMKPTTAKPLQHDEPMPILSYFWKTPSEWPNDPPGYIFLARAFDQIGSVRFIEKWSKKEETVDLDADDLALTETELEHEAMWVAIKDEIVKHCSKGDLVSAVRKIRGGAMTVLGWEMWNAENLDWRFDRCQMSLDRPFERCKGTHWIFIQRNSLDSFLAGLAGDVSPTEASRHSKPVSSELGSTSEGLQTRTRGRPPGTGSWATADDLLLAGMRELIKAGKAKSPNDAARQVAGEAPGSGTIDSKITRLAKRYRAQQSPDRK